MSFELKNVIEELVKDKARELVEKDEQLKGDEKSYLDVCAIVLNHIPNKYVVTMQGEAYTKLEFLRLQYKVDILTEILKAMEKVKKYPQH